MTPQPHLDAALDKLSFDWLTANLPELVTALERDAATMTPEQIYRHVLTCVGVDRENLALRCKQAARHIRRAA